MTQKTGNPRQVHYLDYLNDMKRISHAVQGLSTEALKTENPGRQQKKQLLKQVRERKRVMAALHTEIRELEEKL